MIPIAYNSGWVRFQGGKLNYSARFRPSALKIPIPVHVAEIQ